MAAVPSIGRASLVERPGVAPQAAATQGLYERHAAKIQAYCRHQLGSREEAEDAVQTTFMNAFRALGRGVVPEAEGAWLFKIAENVCLSRRRSSWRRGRIESPSDFEVIEEVVPGPSRQRDELIGIEDALASMPEQQRRAILLREWQGLSYREVAEELEISQSAVETLIFRARRSLAQGLEQPETIAKTKRKSLRRALHVIDFGTLIAAAKTLLAGSAAVKATAAAVAVTAAAGTAATVVPKIEPQSPKPTVVREQVAPARAPVPAAPAAAAAATVRFVPAGVDSKPAPKISRPNPAAANVHASRVNPQRPAPTVPAVADATVGHEPPAAPAPATPAATPVAEAQQQPAPVAAVPPAEVKNDEGQSDRTDRRTEGIAPVAPTAPAPSPPSDRTGRSTEGAAAVAPTAPAPSPLPPTVLPVAVPTPTSPLSRYVEPVSALVIGLPLPVDISFPTVTSTSGTSTTGRSRGSSTTSAPTEESLQAVVTNLLDPASLYK